MLDKIAKLIRVENVSNDDMHELCIEMTHSVYPHEEVFANIFTLQQYIDAPGEQVFNFLQAVENIDQWMFNFRLVGTSAPNNTEKLYYDCINASNQRPFILQQNSTRAAATIDQSWHSALDPDHKLTQLMRVIDARVALKKPGSIVLCDMCIMNLQPASSESFGLQDWKLFPALKRLELANIKAILETNKDIGQ